MAAENPTWLNGSFIYHVLESIEGPENKIKIVKFLCEPAVPPGYNFMSYIHRLRVEYKIDEKSVKVTLFIVKTPLNSGERRSLVEILSGYDKELKVYNEILPKMLNLYKIQVTPRAFLCSLENSLVLEDLKENGYKMCDKLKQLDFQHCQCFLESLAKLHAVSVGTYNKHPELNLDSLKGVFFFNEDKPECIENLSDNIEKHLRAMVNTIQKLHGCEEYVVKVLKVIDNSYWERIINLTKRREGLKVLSHGDSWTPNILFKYNDMGEVVDAKLVDFQLVSYTSVAFDILFFWWSSANEDVRENHRDQLFEYYRNTLNKTLLELNCDTVSKESFDNEIRSIAPFSIAALGITVPTAMADPEDFVDFTKPNTDFLKDSINYDTAEWYKNHRSKYYKAVLPKMLRQIEQIGAFE